MVAVRQRFELISSIPSPSRFVLSRQTSVTSDFDGNDAPVTLTYNAVAGATRLRRAAVHVEIGVTAGTPLPQDAGRRVYDVHEVRIRRVQVPGPVVAHVEYDRRVQAGDPADFARLDEVGRQPGDVSPDAVPAARIHPNRMVWSGDRYENFETTNRRVEEKKDR